MVYRHQSFLTLCHLMPKEMMDYIFTGQYNIDIFFRLKIQVLVVALNWQLIVMEAGGGHWAIMVNQITFANTEVSQLY